MALTSSAGHRDELWQDGFGVKPDSWVSEARLRAARHRAGTDLPTGVHRLYQALPKCQGALAPDVFSRDFLPPLLPLHSAPRLLSCTALELEHRQSCTCKEGKEVAEPTPAPRSLVFSESGAVFLVLISPHYCGVRGIFCTLFSQEEKRLFKGVLWAQSHWHYSHTLQTREVSAPGTTQLEVCVGVLLFSVNLCLILFFIFIWY